MNLLHVIKMYQLVCLQHQLRTFHRNGMIEHVFVNRVVYSGSNTSVPLLLVFCSIMDITLA